jgi:hypothetical protein
MQDNLPCKKITLDKPEGRSRVGWPNLRWLDGWNNEGCREVGSQKLEDQGQGQRCLEAITRVCQDPAWIVAPGWMDGWMDTRYHRRSLESSLYPLFVNNSTILRYRFGP